MQELKIVFCNGFSSEYKVLILKQISFKNIVNQPVKIRINLEKSTLYYFSTFLLINTKNSQSFTKRFIFKTKNQN